MTSRLARAFAALVASAAFLSAPASAIDPSYSGSWFNPPESGSGFNLEIFDTGRALLFWYTYDEAGDPVWLYSEGAIEGDAIDFVVYYSDGMRFSNLDTADKNNRRWGSLTMTFQDCNHATITYGSELGGISHSPEGTRTHPVERLVNIATLPCRRPASGYWQGFHYDPKYNDNEGAWHEIGGVLTEDGRMFMNSVKADKLYVGTYETEGSTVTLDYRVCTENGEYCYPGSASGQFGHRDYIRGTTTNQFDGTLPIRLTYRGIYDRPVTLASLEGRWTDEDGDEWWTFHLNHEGRLSGTDSSGCQYSGQLEPIDDSFNAFALTAAMSVCGYEIWDGVVVLGDEVPGDARNLEFWVTTQFENGAFSFRMRR